ncbi:hypothetical protein EVG20_g9564, partial [Dentipellis fragilis]
MSSTRSRWGPILSLLVLSPLFIGAPLFAIQRHYALPDPIRELVNPVTNLPQLSETQILSYAQHLSEDIGFRTVGTYEHALADEWITNKLRNIKHECEEIVNKEAAKTGSKRKLECEFWRQQGSGSHRFDMMGKRLYKTYVDLTNIVVRVSDGTSEGKEHAVLVNAHLDSTLPSPGAADDALAVGIMLECIRVLTHTPGWEPKHAIIFLFNHAEESLQDASQLYSTQHPTRSSVRAFINLEAAGTVGPELLFQANSEQMIQAYSKVPRPFGTVVANEIFSSGVLLSDTDFRQFELYLNVTGLDLAVVGNSYLYHTRKHFAENVMAILEYLTSDESSLPELDYGYSKPSTVFFSHLGRFFLYSYTTAQVLYALLVYSAVVFVTLTWPAAPPALKKGSSSNKVVLFFTEQPRGIVAVVAGFLGAITGTNLLAAVMHYGLGKNMSWFSSEAASLALYGPAALAGAFASQLLLPRLPERNVFTATLLTQSVLALVIQLVGFGSAALFYLSALPLFLALVLDYSFNSTPGTIALWTYAFGQLSPLLTGTQMLCTTLDVFVPLTGRIGREAPAEHIIASIVAISGAYTLPLALPFAHRYGPRVLSRTVVLLLACTVASAAYFATREPFDPMHQKRLFVLESEDVRCAALHVPDSAYRLTAPVSASQITTSERFLHIGAADGAPGLDALVAEITAEFGAPGTSAVQEIMDDNNSDWDILYPFSSFMSPYKVAVPTPPDYVSPFAAGGPQEFTVSAVNDMVDLKAGTRSLTLKVTHPGVIWTVIAFDAHVLKWTLDDSPPDEHTRHFIKEGSYYGVETWTVDLVVKIPPGDATRSAPLRVNFMGARENAMWARQGAGEGPGRACDGAVRAARRMGRRAHGRARGCHADWGQNERKRASEHDNSDSRNREFVSTQCPRFKKKSESPRSEKLSTPQTPPPAPAPDMYTTTQWEGPASQSARTRRRTALQKPLPPQPSPAITAARVVLRPRALDTLLVLP